MITKGTDVHFVGPFNDLLTQFVKMKCSLGFSYVSSANILERFSKFTVTLGLKEPSLTKEVALLWTKKRDWESDRTYGERISNLRQFSLFLVDLGYPAFIPICIAKIDRHKFVPYIFNSEELQRFFYTCDTLSVSKRTNRNILLPVLFRLLYSTGLRISEATKLKLCDIDFNNYLLTIKNGKGGKDRLIPISLSLKLFMETLLTQLHQLSTPQDYFFLNQDRTRYKKNTAYENFRKILWQSGISHGGKGVGPRMHDLRHTFAVHSLMNMVKRGINIYCALPILSTYLGHTSISSTEYYVRLTAEFFPDIIKLVDPVSKYILPAVYHETY